MRVSNTVTASRLERRKPDLAALHGQPHQSIVLFWSQFPLIISATYVHTFRQQESWLALVLISGIVKIIHRNTFSTAFNKDRSRNKEHQY